MMLRLSALNDARATQLNDGLNTFKRRDKLVKIAIDAGKRNHRYRREKTKTHIRTTD